MKIPIRIMIAFMFILMMVACGGETTSPPSVETQEVVVEEPVQEPTQEPVQEPATEAPAPTEIPAEEITITMWWWGEQNVPGLQAYIQESAQKYKELHPNITVVEVLQGDETVTAFNAAVAAGEGPDIATLWYGMYFMPDVFKGNVLPLNDFLPEDELSHWLAAPLHTWDGKVWGFDLITTGHPFVYNKEMFEKAGLDPENPPKTFDELLLVCDALNAVGIIPMATGTKDGWMGDVMADVFGQQDLESSFDVMKAVVGDLKFNDKEFAGYWERLDILKKRGCFNENATSIGTWDARLMIPAEQAAMGFPAMETALIWIREMGPDKIGIMAPPMTTKEVPIPVEADVQFIPSFAKHPKEAAQFLAFLRTPERMEAMYTQLGLIPADDRFDLDLIEEPVVRKYAEMIFEGYKVQSRQVESWLPYEIVGDGLIIAFQKLWAGEVTPQGAADIVEEAAALYRELNPDMLEIFRDWMVELGVE